MARGRDPNFDGSYGTSRYADKPLEEDIRRAAEDGIIVGETEDGEMFKENLETDRVDTWVKGEPGKYTQPESEDTVLLTVMRIKVATSPQPALSTYQSILMIIAMNSQY